MPLQDGQTSVRGTVSGTYTKTLTGFASGTQKPSLSFSFAPDADVYDYPVVGTWTMTAGASVAVDLYDVVFFGDYARLQSVCGLLLTATASVEGGKLRFEPGDTNPYLWQFAAADNALIADVGTGTSGCGILLWNGTALSLTLTAREIKLSNPGTQTITAKLMAIAAGHLAGSWLDFSDYHASQWLVLEEILGL